MPALNQTSARKERAARSRRVCILPCLADPSQCTLFFVSVEGEQGEVGSTLVQQAGVRRPCVSAGWAGRGSKLTPQGATTAKTKWKNDPGPLSLRVFLPACCLVSSLYFCFRHSLPAGARLLGADTFCCLEFLPLPVFMRREGRTKTRACVQSIRFTMVCFCTIIIAVCVNTSTGHRVKGNSSEVVHSKNKMVIELR
ncbi:unnamed protein product [Discosporangium mesarthrocarpum]